MIRAAAAVAVAAAVAIGFALAGDRSSGSGIARSLAPLSSLGPLEPASPPGRLGPEGVPVPAAPSLAAAGDTAVAKTIDGVKCERAERVVYHVHAHLTLFVDGAARRVPYGIGIGPPWQVDETLHGPFVAGGACFAWLHTHAADGVIHVESPTARTYTLGDFFDIWGQPLSRTGVGPAHGRVTALVDGRVYKGNPRLIPLFAHAQVQLEVGRPLVAPETIVFPSGL